MKIVYGKKLTNEEFVKCQQIAVECGILTDTAKLLLYREIDTVEKAKSFLSPGKRFFNNPFLLGGMSQAVERIALAKQNQENVLIFGDYDADGICATAVLYYCLKDFGVNARAFIPEREDGYGLNIEKIKQLNEQLKIDLIITVDCGISDSLKIKEINKMGIEVIVTDHHEPPIEQLDCIAINPKLENQDYPFNGLCGAGVAYKLGNALIGEKANDYLDFTALATVADSMDLIGENRDIVVEGLKLFNKKNIRPQFQAILSDNSERAVTAQTLAYNVAPKVNAGGRMGDANLALRLFLTDDQNQIFDYTAKLTEYNISRQVECDRIYLEAKAIIDKNELEKDQIILVKNNGWQPGFIGIVAAKLVEDYSRPVVVFAEQDGNLKGSARSIEQINIYEAILSCSDILLAFGGHSQAAGISVRIQDFELLRSRLNSFVSEFCGKLDFEKKVYAEWDIEGKISLNFAKELEMLEPFGVGNKRPLFTTTVGAVNSRPLKLGSQHYTYYTDTIEMLDFNGASNVKTLALPIDKKILFEVNLSSYKNSLSLKGYSKQVVVEYGDYAKVLHCIFANQLENLLVENYKGFTQIDKSQIASFKTVGTLFIVSDVATLKRFPELSDLDVNLFTVEGRNTACRIVVAPSAIPDGFKKIVYLDRPLCFINANVENYLASDEIGYKILDKLSLDRAVFAEYFVKLKELHGKDFSNIWNFCDKYCGDSDIFQFILSTTIFMELNIFSNKSGKFIFNSNIKNPLTNSKVYSKISLIKG